MKVMAVFVVLLSLSTFSIVANANTVFDKQVPTKVLVFGGTGRLGSDIVKALLADGHNVTVFSRQSSNRKRLANVSVDYVIGDVLIESTVVDAISARKFDVVIDALSRGNKGVEFYQIAAENIVTGIASSNVEQVILHGSVGAGNSRSGSSANGVLSGVMKTKTVAEEVLQASGVRYTIIRNYQLLKYGTAETGNAALYDDVTVTGPVTREGLARLNAKCTLNAECYDKIYHAADLTRKTTRAHYNRSRTR